MIRVHSRLPAVLVALVASGACGAERSGTTDITEPPPPAPTPEPGVLEIGVATTGVRLDPDGYTIEVQGLGNRQVSAVGTITYADVAPGDYVVRLSEAALNCPVTPRDARTVSVEPGLTTRFDFEVECGLLGYVANSGETFVSVFETASNTAVATIDVGIFPRSVAASPDAAFVYVASGLEGFLSVIDTETQTVERQIPVGGEPTDVAVSPAGDIIYVTNSYDETVSVVSTDSYLIESTISVGAHPESVAFTPDGTLAFVTNRDDGTISIIDTALHSILSVVDLGSRPLDVTVSADGEFVYVADGYSRVWILDSLGRLIDSVVIEGASHGVVESYDKAYLYASAFFPDLVSPRVAIIDIASREVVSTAEVYNAPMGITRSPDGRRIYVTSFSAASVTVLDAEDFSLLDVIGVGGGPMEVTLLPF